MIRKGSGFDSSEARAAIYVGEAESIKERLKHLLGKDYWNHVTFFTSKDESLTKAHIRYLEGRLIKQAKQVNRSLVKNNQASGALLPEADRAEMEVFLEKMYQLLPVLGINDFVPVATPPSTASEHQTLVCEIKGLRALARLVPGGIVVLANSQAVEEVRASAAQQAGWILKARSELLQEGTLIQENGYLRFTKDTGFASPSAAAGVIQGGATNGLTAWKDLEGRTLKQLEAS